MNCNGFRDALSAWLAVELDPEAAAEAKAHCAACDACAAEAARFRRLLATLDGLPDPAPDEALRFKVLDRLVPKRGAPAPEVMDVEDLLAYLGVTLEQLEQEIENLPAFEFAGRLKFKKSHIDRWIEEREQTRRAAIEAARARSWMRQTG